MKISEKKKKWLFLLFSGLLPLVEKGEKVLMEMRRRLGKVSGGDWPDVEEEYRQLVKSKKENMVVAEKHG